MTDIAPSVHKFIEMQLAAQAQDEPDIAFPPEEYESRLCKLRTRMAAAAIDLLLVSSPEGICWLHGYRSRWNKAHSPLTWAPLQATAVHVEHDHFIVFETLGHEQQLRMTSVSTDNRLSREWELDGMLKFVIDELAGEGWLKGTVGLEMRSPIPYRLVSEAVESSVRSRGCRVVDASQIVREVQRAKSRLEIQRMEEAAEIADAGLLALKDALRPGITELEAWGELIRGMAAAGGEPAALHESVVVGPLGHMISSRRRLERGDYVSADPGGVSYAYNANVSRAFFLGEPPIGATRIAEVGAGAFDVLCATAKAGTPVREVNRALREYYLESGLWGVHGWMGDEWIGGYELGIAFPPDWVGDFIFSIDETDAPGAFEAGMVTNFESLVHVPLVDTLVYEELGARCLSRIPHEIVVID